MELVRSVGSDPLPLYKILILRSLHVMCSMRVNENDRWSYMRGRGEESYASQFMAWLLHSATGNRIPGYSLSAWARTDRLRNASKNISR